MPVSQKGASPPEALKEKPTLLDGDIGKEFLSSWKSMSVTKDSSMDFQLETVTSGKNKAFNFNKMDMDFSLDGAFDKISSFKVDMSDLDFSCAPKKSGKNKERSKDSVSGIHSEKQDQFNFSFDFNELDSFKFDSNSIEEEQISNNCQDSKGSESNKTVYQGFKNHPAEGVSVSGDGVTEVPGMNSEVMPKVESSLSGNGNLDSPNDNCPSKSATFVKEDVSHGTTLPEKTMAANTEVDQQSHPAKEGKPTELHAKQIVQGWPVLSVFGNDSIQQIVTEQQTEMRVTNTEESLISGREQICNARTETVVGSNCKNSLLKDSLSTPITGTESHKSEMNRMTSDNYIPLRITDAPEQVQSDVDHRDTFVANVSNETTRDKANQERQNSPSELLLTPLSSGNSQQIKGIENGVIHSRFFKKPEKAQFQPHQAVPICSGGITKTGAMHLTNADRGRDDINPNATQIENKAVARSLTQGFIECEPPLLGNEKNVKDGGESSGIDNAQNKGKLVGNSVPHHRDATEGEPSLLKNKIKDSTTSSFQVNGSGSTRQTSASCTQRCLPPKLVVSSKETLGNLIISSCGGGKISPFNASKKITDLSSLKSLRSRAMPNDVSNSTLQKQPKSSKNPEQEKHRQENVALKAVYSAGPEKQATPTSLKRKALVEVDDLFMNRPKRLLGSIDGSRQIKDISEALAVDQVCSNANMVDSDTKNVSHDSPKSSWELHMEVNSSEIEIPSVIENDKNIEKAEACTKELEDICNMLKKKHEEAKELLVRAIVNNNNLLMLNHPVYEEKFQAIQKAAARLTFKEVQI